MDNNLNYPLIGICVSENKRLLSDLIKYRIKKFNKRNQAIFFRFKAENFDFNKQLVNGERYDQKSGEWIQNIFPLPNAIFVQANTDPKILKKFESVIGPKVFNNNNFDKWEGYELLAEHTDLQPFLPETRHFERPIELFSFLTKYKDIFLKPITGHSSRRILRVKHHGNGIDVTFAQHKKMRNQSFKTFHAFWEWFSKEFLNDIYIMQRTIETISLDDRSTDIRINMNKNGNGKWTVSLILFRIASNKSHIIPDVGKVLKPEKLIKKYPNNKRKWKQMKKAVIKLAYQICHALDQSDRHMGNLGIDLGMSENGRLWIFEVNPLPYPFDIQINDPSMTKPLEYALYLAAN